MINIVFKVKNAIIVGLLVASTWGYSIDIKTSRSSNGSAAVKSRQSVSSGDATWSEAAFTSILTGSPTGKVSGTESVASSNPPPVRNEGVSWSDAAFSRMFSQLPAAEVSASEAENTKSPKPLNAVAESATKYVNREESPKLAPIAIVVSPMKYIEAKPAVVKDVNAGLPRESSKVLIPIVNKPAEVPKGAMAFSRSPSGVAIAQPVSATSTNWADRSPIVAVKTDKQPSPVVEKAKPLENKVPSRKSTMDSSVKVVESVPVARNIEKIEWTVVVEGESNSSGKHKKQVKDDIAGDISAYSDEHRVSQSDEYGDYERALEYYEKQKYESAISLLNDVLEKGRKDGNDDWRCQELMGRCMNEIGNPVSALMYYRRSLEINPANNELQALVAEMENKVSSWSQTY